ncbi:MAG: glycosyltransferase [Clostridium sp.]|nr:glycosyltransferase [Clostridium sp.]
MYNGGVERVLSSLLYIWTDMNYKVILFTDEEQTPQDYDYPKEVRRVILPAADDMQARLHKLEREICVGRVDIFIQNRWESDAVLWELLLVKSHHIPFVIYTHNHFTAVYTGASDYALALNRVFALADKIISLSDTDEQFYRLCGCNVTQLANPIAKELREVHPDHSGGENRHILWIGRIAPVKRFNDALRIFAEVKKKIPDAELDVVGKGDAPDEENAKRLCKELAIEDSVHFYGYRTEVGEYYRNCAVVLMTSVREGYPTVLVESKAYGRAYVMYSLPYLSLGKDGKGIKTVQIGNIRTMAAELCKVLLDVTLRCRMEDEAKESFTELCRYDHTAKWRKILAELSRQEVETSKRQPDDLVLTMLLNTLRSGTDCRLKSSFEYQVGEKVLKVPRAVLRLIRRRNFK